MASSSLPTPIDAQPLATSTPFDFLDQVSDHIHHPQITALEPSKFTVGPSFLPTAPVDTLKQMTKFFPRYPLDIYMLWKPSLNWGPWFTGHSIKPWPKPCPEWLSWLNRCEKAFSHVWKDVGIYEAIQFSRHPMEMNHHLLAAAACIWSRTTNSFHLPCGPMSPTILDVAALTHLPPHGIVFSTLCKVPSTINFNYKRACVAYGTYIKTERQDTNEVSIQEHCAFLLCWICRSLLCVQSGQMTIEYASIAAMWAAGRRVAVAPIILGQLYRSMYKLSSCNLGVIGGPFWLLQMWFYEYFPKTFCHPYPHTNYGLTSAGSKWILAPFIPMSFEECLAFFRKLPIDRPDEDFFVFRGGYEGPDWFITESFRPLSPAATTELAEVWGSYLTCRDLHYGGLFIGPIYNLKCGVEVYLPQMLADRVSNLSTN